jgi:hypothetical protein
VREVGSVVVAVVAEAEVDLIVVDAVAGEVVGALIGVAGAEVVVVVEDHSNRPTVAASTISRGTRSALTRFSIESTYGRVSSHRLRRG